MYLSMWQREGEWAFDREGAPATPYSKPAGTGKASPVVEFRSVVGRRHSCFSIFLALLVALALAMPVASLAADDNSSLPSGLRAWIASLTSLSDELLRDGTGAASGVDACGCPDGQFCFGLPHFRFSQPVDGARFSVGDVVDVRVHACYVFMPFELEVAVKCANGTEIHTEAEFSFTATHPGVCRLSARDVSGDGEKRSKAGGSAASEGLQTGLDSIEISIIGGPSVSLTSPVANAIYYAGNTVSLTATATDPDGIVERVEFAIRNSVTGQQVFSHIDGNAPYAVNAPNMAVGSYLAIARAFDDDGQEAVDSQAFTVLPINIPPTVSILTPVGSSFIAPATLAFEAAASDADGSVARVEFELRNTANNTVVLSGSDSLPPYTITATGLQVGTYTMTVRAIDDSGAATVAAKSFEVTPAPLVQMVFFEPQGAPHLANGTIQLRARATVQSGSISQVQFWRALGTGHQQIGTGTAVGADSWEFNWAGVPEGTYRVWARGVPTLGEPAWSGFRDIDVVTNTAPDRVTADQLPSPEPNMNGVGAYGQLYDTYRQNIYTVGQQITLRARFSDSQRNLQHVDFYLHAADQQVPRLLRRVTFPVPAAQSSYLADTMVTIDAAMVSHRMQHIYAMAVDSEGLTATSLKAPVAIRQSYSQTFACVLSGGQCARTSQPHRAVPGLIPAVHYDFALGSNGNRGVAGESYFDASALTSTFPIAGNGREDDGSIGCPVGSAWNGPGETNCYLENRRKGTFSSYLVEFTQAGVYELKLCFRNAGIGRAAGGAPAEDLGSGVRLSFEGVDALGQTSTIETFGNIEVDSDSQRVSESSVAHNVTLPDCPSDLRTVRLLDGSGNPLSWPQGFRSRMSVFARAHGTNPYDFDLQWMALLPVPDANNVGIRISQPAMGDVVGFAAGGMQPSVVLRSAVTKNPFRPGGTITYRVVNPTIPGPAGSWQVVPGGAGIPADAPDNSVVLRLSEFAPAPNMQRRWEVNATLNWEGVNYESPTSSFYVTNGEKHEVQWISPTVNQTVSPGQALNVRLRAKHLAVEQSTQRVRLTSRSLGTVPSQMNVWASLEANQSASTCPGYDLGWRCWNAQWTVPSGLGVQYELSADAVSQSDWLTGVVPTRLTLTVPAATLRSASLVVPVANALYAPGVSVPLRGEAIPSPGSVRFERCELAFSGGGCVGAWQQVGGAAQFVGAQWQSSDVPPIPAQGQSARHYRYRFVAMFAGNETVASESTAIVVSSLPPNQAPTVSWMSPEAGANLAIGGGVQLVVSASDPEGQLALVEFSGRLNGQVRWTQTAQAVSGTVGQWRLNWTPVESGTWTLVARARDTHEVQPLSAESSRTFVVHAAPQLGQETPVAVPASVAPASDGVGATAGTFRVDETGAATYSIPLAVVPGRAGVAPEMALSYSSQGGMGVMGRGWSIAGASAITRCRQTAEAGDADAVASGSPALGFDENDRFCLDGQRLMLVASSAQNEANSARHKGYLDTAAVLEFRTEIDSFTRIRAFNTDGVNGPNYFVVQAKDGTTSWYGDSIHGQGLPFMPANFATVARADAALRRNDGSGQAVPANAPVLAFALARRMDSFGNYVDYQYETHQEQGEQLLTRVDFTGKTVLAAQSGSASAPFASIRLVYSNLSAGAVREAWQSGMRVLASKRLDRVRSYQDDSIIREYRLDYSMHMSRSAEFLLGSVTECASAGAAAVCYQPTRFDWTLAGNSVSGPLPQRVMNAHQNVLRYDKGKAKAWQLGDVDGDGRLDIVHFQNQSAGTQRIETLFREVGNAEDGWFPFRALGQFVYSLRAYNDLADAWFLHDFNSDGRDDLMLADVYSEAYTNPGDPPGTQWLRSWRIYPSNGRVNDGSAVFNESSPWLQPCPAGDPDAPNCIPVNSGDFAQAQLVDVNGDGLSDVIYPSPVAGDHSLKIKLGTRTAGGQPGFSRAYDAVLERFSDCSSLTQSVTCTYAFSSVQSRNGRSPYVFDLNADGRGDLWLLANKMTRELCPNGICPDPQDQPEYPMFFSAGSAKDLDEQIEARSSMLAGRAAGTSSTVSEWSFSAQVVDVIDHTGRKIFFKQYARHDLGSTQPSQNQIFPVDMNLDGISDVLIAENIGGAYRVHLLMNTGIGFQSRRSPLASGGSVVLPDAQFDHMQLVDLNNDGYVDLMYPNGTGSNSQWRVHAGGPAGFGAEESAGIVGGVLPSHHKHFFADFDGNGDVEYVRLRHQLDNQSSGEDASHGRLAANSNPALGAGKPAVHIHRIVNGYGADTSIVYQPLTNSAVYLREPRWFGTHPGKGSPVIDLFGAMYVVASVSSDAPGVSATSRRSTLYYQYAGAKLQAGGRGLMGFRQVRTLDPNFDGPAATHVVSITDYGLKGCASTAPAECDEEVAANPSVLRHGFPYVGMARESRQYKVASVVPSQLVACLAAGGNAETAACYSKSGAAGVANPYFEEPTGTLLSYARNRLNHVVTATGPFGERSVFPYIEASFEAKGNPEHLATGRNAVATLSETVSRFEYHTPWGDLLRSAIGTASGSSYASLGSLRIDALARLANASVGSHCAGHGSCVSSAQTVNTWLPSSQPTAANDRDYWRLGRLDKSTVTHWRQGAHGESASSLTRESRFEYDVTGTTRTGALKVERVAGLSAPGSATAANGSPSELRTVRKRDAYGNVTDTFVCSGDVSNLACEDASEVLQRPAGAGGSPLTRVHRHTRTTYDSQGRYPESTQAPYYDGTSDGALRALETVEQRGVLGNVLQTSRLNGGTASATYGPLGRLQSSTDSTGSKSVGEFHWCAGGSATVQVAACPSDIGAVFRQTSYTYGGTRSVTYFDRLGREVFALSEGFNRYDNTAANDWVGVCKTYDGRGRTVAASEPFFVGNVATSGLRPELSTAVGCTSKPGTRTTYDVLDRALTILLPEHAGSTTAMSEMVYSGLQTTTHTRLSRATSPFQTPTVVTLSEVRLHDASGQVLTVTDAEGLEAKYAHDAAGNLIALKRDAGRGEIVSRISYDALGRKTSQVDPDAGTASYAYNAAGELICSQDARGYATITDFDALGRGWRSRTLKTGCASTTTVATTPSNADASVLPAAMTGDHSSVDLTLYDLAANGIGQIESTLRRHRVGGNYGGYRGIAGDQGEFRQASSYDSFGRPSQVTTRFHEPNLNGSGLSEREFIQSTTYDALGRVATTQDATGGVVENMYSAHGFLRRVRDAGQPSLVFWELLETDVRGQTTLDRRHGKVELTQQRQYNEVTGRLARIVTGTWSSNQIHSAVQNLSYVFDAQGNLLSRKDERVSGREEVFVYDRLNRLIEARLSGVSPTPGANTPTLTLSYDKLGNICSKNGLGYTYAGPSGCGRNGLIGGGSEGGASPHAVTARGPVGSQLQYQYDAAGNMTTTTGGSNGTRTVRFDGAGNADRLSISTQSTSFWYAGGGRYLRLDESGDVPAKLTRYLGGVEWIVRSGGVEERKRSIGGFLLLTETVTAPQQPPTRKYRYLLADHLGSTDTLVDENGVVHERMSFDAHGSRRAADTGPGMWASLLPAVAHTDINPQINAETTRGFTGHEHVDRMGLIHMNGRLYDPLLGRMLSPDPIVQEPYNAQNLNRYSYVLNNPLSYTDPSGLSFVKKYWRQIVVAAISIFVPPLGAWAAVTIGAVSGYIATGTVEGALWGGFTAGVFWSIGQAFQGVNTGAGTGFAGTGLTKTQFAGKVLAHATAGGVVSVLQGGKFGHGFASAGISQAAVPATHGVQSMAARTALHAMIGGTASVASGGKFANGAVTAAMAFAYNEKAHSPRSSDAILGTINGDGISPHIYMFEEQICSGLSSACTVEQFQEKWALDYSAPAQQNRVGNGVVNQLKAFGVWGWRTNPVVHEVEFYPDIGLDAPFMRTANITLPGHALIGRVDRYYFNRSDGIYVVTRGVGFAGDGPPLNYLNNLVGPDLFRSLNQDMRAAIFRASSGKPGFPTSHWRIR